MQYMSIHRKKNVVQAAPRVELMDGWICACVTHTHTRARARTHARTTHTHIRTCYRLCIGACTRACCGPMGRFDIGTFLLLVLVGEFAVATVNRVDLKKV